MQLTMRLRKPGIILLTGTDPDCQAVRAALEALGPGFRCEIWAIPDASDKLKDAVTEHDGEVWDVWWDPDDTLDPASIETPHGLITRSTWAECARVALQEWL